MDPDRVVVIDISSDEDEDLCHHVLDPVAYSDRAELFDHTDGRGEEEADDVVVIEEFSTPAKTLKRNVRPLGLEKGIGPDGEDDDCLVLDSDPDKPVFVDSKKDGNGDDLQIVAEKGQLACRDYPHPRHLCANFRFSSSPHVKYCDLCHCYVCDLPAPCNYWGNGNLSDDHCHSTDNEGSWKKLRQSFKQKDMARQPEILTGKFSVKIPPSTAHVARSRLIPKPGLVLSVERSNSLQPFSATSISNTDAINQRNLYQPTILSCHEEKLVQKLAQRSTVSLPLDFRIDHVQRDCQRNNESTIPIMTALRRTRKIQAGFNNPSKRSHKTAFSHDHIQNAEPVTSQTPRCPEGSQQRCQSLSIASPDVSTDQLQEAVSSQLKHSMCPPVRAADISQKIWQDILASVESEQITDSQHLL